MIIKTVLTCAFLFLTITPSFCLDKTADSTVKPDTSVAEKANVPDTLIVQARLLETPESFPSNDIYDYVYIFKYKVLKVEKGTYNDKEILVGQYNPLIPRSQIKDKMNLFVNGNVRKFEAGTRHRLTLISPVEIVWNDAVEDEFFENNATRFFAVITDNIK